MYHDYLIFKWKKKLKISSFLWQNLTFDALCGSFDCVLTMLPNHLSKETTILDVVIRTPWLKEKYFIHGAFNSSTLLKGCNEVSNVGITQGLELVHHLVKFLTLKNFHRSFAILIEQMMSQEGFTCIQSDYKKIGIKGMKT